MENELEQKYLVIYAIDLPLLIGKGNEERNNRIKNPQTESDFKERQLVIDIAFLNRLVKSFLKNDWETQLSFNYNASDNKQRFLEHTKELIENRTEIEITYQYRIYPLGFKGNVLNWISERMIELQSKETESQNKVTSNKEFTTARQVLAMHYIFEYLQIKNIDNTHKAKFIEFLTGKNYKNIYDSVCSPLEAKKSTKYGGLRKKDLQFIRPYFEKLNLTEIVKMINNELEIPH